MLIFWSPITTKDTTFSKWDSPSPSHLKHQPKWVNVRRWKETKILSASDPIAIWLYIFAKILPTLQPHMLVQAKTLFPSKEMQKSQNPSNEPLCAPSLVVLYRWLVEFPEDVHKTKKLGINGHNNISKGHPLP